MTQSNPLSNHLETSEEKPLDPALERLRLRLMKLMIGSMLALIFFIILTIGFIFYIKSQDKVNLSNDNIVIFNLEKHIQSIPNRPKLLNENLALYELNGSELKRTIHSDDTRLLYDYRHNKLIAIGKLLHKEDHGSISLFNFFVTAILNDKQLIQTKGNYIIYFDNKQNKILSIVKAGPPYTIKG